MRGTPGRGAVSGAAGGGHAGGGAGGWVGGCRDCMCRDCVGVCGWVGEDVGVYLSIGRFYDQVYHRLLDSSLTTQVLTVY